MADKVRKYSRKREAIRRALAGTKTHPSAEWIYERLKPEISDLSLATVYRNLSEMKHSGEIQSVAFFGGRERFDGCTEKHSHFICDRCGRIDDFNSVCHDSSLDDDAQRCFDGRIDYHSLVFHGICKDCMSIQETP